MNKARRKRLSEIIDQLTEIGSSLDELANEEQEAFDNMPESLQGSERGDFMSQVTDTFSEACSDIESIIDNLETCLE